MRISDIKNETKRTGATISRLRMGSAIGAASDVGEALFFDMLVRMGMLVYSRSLGGVRTSPSTWV